MNSKLGEHQMRGALAALAIAMTLPSRSFAQAADLDLLIRGGTVLDGTGAAGRRADVGIRDGKIVFVGAAGTRRAKRTIDATNLIVAPGFIDVHNHTDEAIADSAKRLNEGFIRQGVTTIVGSPDGEFAPAQIKRYLEAYRRQGIGTNVAFYVGHNGVRREVMGKDQQRPPTPAELERMKALVREGMQLGAIGLSTGLMYEPGMFSKTDEVIALAKEVKPFDGIYDSHVREPGHHFLESDQEVIDVAEGAGIPGKIGHEKAVGLNNEGKIQDVIRMVNAARARGVQIVTDQYPYDGAAVGTLTGIIVVPPDLRVAGFDLKKALADPASRAKLKVASENGVNGGFAWLKASGYNMMRITSSKDYPQHVGKYLSELATEQKKDPFDLVRDLVLGAADPVSLTLGAVKEKDVRDLMVQPWNMIASDGSWSDGVTPRGHPRATGTFPRVLGRYVRDEKLLSLEDAVRKMTSLPADFSRIRDRGRLAEGLAADVTVFDPKTVRDRSTWDEPFHYAEGVIDVIVNGVPVLLNGTMTGAAPGKFVPRQSGRAPTP